MGMYKKVLIAANRALVPKIVLDILVKVNPLDEQQ
jgi:hypothetical protein